MATIEFVPLKDFENDYEILSQYPYTIRKKDNHYVISVYNNHTGYPTLHINGYPRFKHGLIAKQFIPNDDPEHKVEVDHINHDKNDFHLENLRWVSKSMNQKNKASYKGIAIKYHDSIPDDAIAVKDYGKHQFEDYYYYNDKFYFYNGKQYKEMHINEDKRGSLYITIYNIHKKRVNVFYSQFKKIYNLI